MKEKFESEYLNKKLEPISEVKEPETVKLSEYKEFGEHSYDTEKGRFEFTLGDTKILLEYSTPDLDKLLDDKAFFSGLVKSGNVRLFDNFAGKMAEITNNIRVIDKFSLENGDGKYDIGEIFKDGKIFFNYMGNPEFNSSVIHLRVANLFLVADPLTPDGLVILSHEIGHYKDYQNKDNENSAYGQANTDKERKFREASIWEEGEEKLEGTIVEEGAQIRMIRERTAWAIALKNIKPFLTDLKIDPNNLKEFIHNYSLQAHSNFVRNVIE